MDDRFYELNPDREADMLMEENKSLQQKISEMSFGSIRQTTHSFTNMPGNKEDREIAPTKPYFGTQAATTISDLELNISETSFKPLPFHRVDAKSPIPKFNGKTDNKVQLKEYSVDLSKYALEAQTALSGTANDELLQKFVSPKDFKKIGHFESIESASYKKDDDSVSFRSINHNTSGLTREISERFIGEIAFQLDRRILKRVFSHRKRLYGFTVRNMQEKIDEYCTDYTNNTVDTVKQSTLTKKLKSVMQLLKKNSGYNEAYHPIFSEMIVNKYGVLRTTDNASSYERYANKESLKSIILQTMQAESEYTYDAIVLLNALICLSERDNKPLLIR